MIIDFHTHIFPPETRRNREKYFHGEPGFELLYNNPKARLVGAKELVETMDEQEVDLSVAAGFPWKNPDLIKRHNDYLIESVAKYPERLKGLGCFDHFSQIASAETERCLKNGLSGIGELAFYQSEIDEMAIERLEPVMKLCEQKNAPVLFHANEPIGHSYPGKSSHSITQIYKLPARFPQNKIVLAHWGGGLFFYWLLKKEVKPRLKNVYFDTAASPFLYDPEVYALALRIIGAEKIIFGSDYPLIKPKAYFKELSEAKISAEEIKRICGDNAAGLLD